MKSAPSSEEITLEKLRLSFLRFFAATGAEKAVVGVSGGVDSALTAALLSKALGPENILGIFMPYKTSDAASAEDAKLLSDALGLKLETADITPAADAFFKSCGETTSLRRGNVLARLRMTVLFDRAAAVKGIVAGTSNKTEILLGYGTWHGDTASSINLLGDLYKNEVRKLAAEAGVPKRIVEKPPTADLWPGQTDEEELGFSYDEADKFFYATIDCGMEAEELTRLFGGDLVKKISLRVLKNSFKRKLPEICRARESGERKDFDAVFKSILGSL